MQTHLSAQSSKLYKKSMKMPTI